MVGVSVACSSIELVPSVISPTVHWWIQMVGVSVACSLYQSGAECNKTYCALLDTDGGVSVSPVPLLSWCQV